MPTFPGSINYNPNWLVLDVGSGDNPDSRADVLVDKLVSDNRHRQAQRKLLADSRLVIADGLKLPFGNKTFDFVICSHLLEHMSRPAQLISELVRVGKSGLIRTPSPIRERVWNFSFHRWYVYARNPDGAELVLVKKNKAKNWKSLAYLEASYLPDINFYWQEKIHYKIYDRDPPGFLKTLDKELASLGQIRSGQIAVKKLIQKLKDKLFPIQGIAPNVLWLKNNFIRFGRIMENSAYGFRRKKVDIFSLLVCPKCRTRLIRKKTCLVCSACGRDFQFYQGKYPYLIL